MKKQFSVGIDIGSTKIVTVVSNLQEGIVDIVGIGLAPTSGVRKGVVTDIEETVSSISASLEEAERMSGIPITEANISINGAQISSDVSHGIIAVSRADGEIAESDVERVVEAARSVNIPPNREIIHSIPRTFSVDGQTGISDPIGMSGIRLEVDTIVISSAANPLKNLLKCLNQAGIAPQELVFAPLAAAKIAVSKRQKEIGVVLIDIGSSNTNFV
ncbi:MAG: Cell division protein ftsA, partial [Candidatus Gottesmanbacteria bacterium GW2011_GWC2_39_8]